MIYERIRNLREDRDLKQREIAALLNVTQTSYSRYELGQREIPTEILITLARFYDVSLDYLVGETDIKRRYPEKKRKYREKTIDKQILP